MSQFDGLTPASLGGSAMSGAPGSPGTLPTGHPDVDATVASLADLDSTPPLEQVERYAQAHRSLQQILRTIDAA